MPYSLVHSHVRCHLSQPFMSWPWSPRSSAPAHAWSDMSPASLLSGELRSFRSVFQSALVQASCAVFPTQLSLSFSCIRRFALACASFCSLDSIASHSCLVPMSSLCSSDWRCATSVFWPHRAPFAVCHAHTSVDRALPWVCSALFPRPILCCAGRSAWSWPNNCVTVCYRVSWSLRGSCFDWEVLRVRLR